MSILHAITLGIVQGLTEFLPVSSSGHLQLVPWLFGWDDFAGDESLEKAFDVALHIGTLVGALAYFRHDVVALIHDGIVGLGRRPMSPTGRMAWLLVLSAVPAGITGVLLEDTIERTDNEIWLTAVLLIVFGFVLLWADRLGGERPESSFGVRDSLSIGAAQALALWPGVSRSGVTITTARYREFDRPSATRIAFLMSLPIIAGAGVFKLIDIGGVGGIPDDARAAFLWGMVASALTGWFAVWALIKFVQSRSFTPFVVYRVVVGCLVLLLLATGVR